MQCDPLAVITFCKLSFWVLCVAWIFSEGSSKKWNLAVEENCVKNTIYILVKEENKNMEM
jgi:hypothetical protein